MASNMLLELSVSPGNAGKIERTEKLNIPLSLIRRQKWSEIVFKKHFSERVAQGYSAWMLQTERSALRLFFEDRELAAEVTLPRRKREHITRSRLPVVRDRHFQPNNWPLLVRFVLACGLRREELRDLRVGDIITRTDGQLVVHVRKGKGRKERSAAVFPGQEEAVLAVKGNRPDDELAFDRLPGAMDIHVYRRRFAQELYELLPGRPLPLRRCVFTPRISIALQRSTSPDAWGITASISSSAPTFANLISGKKNLVTVSTRVWLSWHISEQAR